MSDRHSVIIVDSDMTDADVLRAGLTAEGYNCHIVATAKEALERMVTSPADVIVADLVPPDHATLDLARNAKRVKPDAGFIVLVHDIERFPYEAAVEHGVSDFAVRPVSIRELSLRVRHVVHQETVRAVSVIDELTGLYNRRGFTTLAEQQLKLARRQGKGIFMLYADVDDLKAINDTFGHSAGDIALIEAGQLLKTTYRESDIVARIAGDEFVVIPIGSSGDNIPTICARLTTNLAASRDAGDLKYLRALSIGVAYYDPSKPCTLEEFLAEGDRRMYDNKRGRNTV